MGTTPRVPPDEQPEFPVIPEPSMHSDSLCPVCGAPLLSEKCKVVCRSEHCRYRLVFNCAEF